MGHAINPLSEDIVRAARADNRRGESVTSTARRHGVGVKTLWVAVTGQTWTHLPGAMPVTDRAMRRRFWSKVDESGGPDACWLWTRQRTAKGYGIFSWSRQEPRRAHRVAWELVNGPIPDGLNALHRCDNPPCVNPSHLWLGTTADNNADMTAKGRARRNGNTVLTAARGERHSSRTHPESVLRGSAHWKTKLTEDDVREIRRVVGAGEVRQAELARRYGVTRTAISLIIRGVSWKHLT